MSDDLLKEFAHSESRARAAESLVPSEDDFGDFEVADQAATHAPSKAISQPALVNDVAFMPSATAEAGSSAAPTHAIDRHRHGAYGQGYSYEAKGMQEDWGDFQNGTILFDSEAEASLTRLSPQREVIQANIAPSVEVDDDDFDAWEPAESGNGEPTMPALQPESARSTAAPPKHVPSSRSGGIGPPPSNIPPPSLLLSLGAATIRAIGSSLKQSSQKAGEEQPVGNPSILVDFQALGRVLAGRKLRWKRDGILSQSMNIGMAGKQGGMKLTKVDRSENRREDQEAAEMLDVWKYHAGAFRTFFASSGFGQMPELEDNMPVRVEKAAGGAVPAPKPCFLCGLKREERVQKLDFRVEDSFGEWWTDHWGHVACVEFWNRHRASLPSR